MWLSPQKSVERAVTHDEAWFGSGTYSCYHEKYLGLISLEIPFSSHILSSSFVCIPRSTINPRLILSLGCAYLRHFFASTSLSDFYCICKQVAGILHTEGTIDYHGSHLGTRFA